MRSLCAKAMAPDPGDPTTPHVAAVCIYNDLVPVAVDALKGSSVHVAAVTTAFPSGRATMAVKLTDTRDAIRAGAHEIDMVIDRGAFLSGRYLQVFNEIAAIKAACVSDAPNGAPAHLEGHPGDRRAGDLRQRAARLVAGDAGGRELHQDLDGQNIASVDGACSDDHARGGPRLA